MTDKSIPIESEVRDELRGMKTGNDTYTDVIRRLIEAYSSDER